MPLTLRNLLLAGLLVALFGPQAWGIDRIEEFNKARRTIQHQLRSKQTADRIEATKQLQQYPIEDSVRLIYGCLSDGDSEVRDAAFKTLLKMNGNQEVCDTLLLIAQKSLNRRDNGQHAAPSLAILITSDLPSVKRETNEFLEKSIGTSIVGPQLVVTLADELGNHRDVSDVAPLVHLANTKVFAGHFGVRRAVVHALTQIPKPEAIGALIEIMPKVGGEAQADAVDYLSQVTEQIFGMDAAAWGRWWADSKDTFEYPKRIVQSANRTLAAGTGGDYYGLPLFAERLVFVLDTSGSMNGQRIYAAKRELLRAISGLPDHAYFGIVVFNSHVDVWHRQLVQATDQAKKEASFYVNNQEARLNTASSDALEAAMKFDTEAIYFLSDGAPNGGKILAPVDIVNAVTAINRSRRISIYTIGVGAGFPGGPLDEFLKTLAEQNLGQYRRVDE